MSSFAQALEAKTKQLLMFDLTIAREVTTLVTVGAINSFIHEFVLVALAPLLCHSVLAGKRGPHSEM